MSEDETCEGTAWQGPDDDTSERREDDGRKRRTTVTQKIVRSLTDQINSPNRPPLRVIANNLDISLSTLTRLLKKIREGTYNFGKHVMFIPKKKGRKSVYNKDRVARVKAVMTSEPTMTLDKARENLASDGIHMGRTQSGGSRRRCSNCLSKRSHSSLESYLTGGSWMNDSTMLSALKKCPMMDFGSLMRAGSICTLLQSGAGLVSGKLRSFGSLRTEG